jgi:O-antigen/teichoic acid export membrane protein
LDNEGIDRGILFSSSEIVRYGFMSQLASVLNYLVSRISFFVLGCYREAADLGVYSVAVAVCETILLIAGSISLVQYVKVSNMGNCPLVKELSAKLAIVSALVTFIGAALLVIIPSSVLSSIFGNGFAEAKKIILILSLGIVALGFGTVLSHYFGGIGEYRINVTANMIGLVVCVVGNLFLVARFGIIGAAIATTLSYCTIVIFTVLKFFQSAHINPQQLKLTKDDLVSFHSAFSGLGRN